MKTRNTNKSYLWMKKYMKTHKTSVFENTVYFCIKHNLSGDKLKKYMEWAGGKSLKALSSKGITASIEFEHSEETRRMFPTITDELFELGQGENYRVDVESQDRFYPVYFLKSERKCFSPSKFDSFSEYGDSTYWVRNERIAYITYFSKIYSKESDYHPISISLRNWWNRQSYVYDDNDKIKTFVAFCMVLYDVIKRLDGTDEIDTSKSISKKLGDWVRPLTPSEKKQQKKKQLLKTLNKKEKEILEYIKKKDLSETFMFLLSE